MTKGVVGLLLSAMCGFSAMADTNNFEPAKVSGGVQAARGYCPCLRIVVRARGAGGTIAVKKFLISTDALLKFDQGRGGNPVYNIPAWQYFTVGALEAMLKGGRLHLGFDGVTWGDDLDRGYSDLMRTGASLAVSLVRTAAFELKIKHGYQFEKFSVNQAPETSQHDLPQTLSMRVNLGPVTAQLAGGIAVSPNDLTDLALEQVKYSVNADVHSTLFRLKGIGMGLGIEAQHEFDPFRRDIGLEPSSSSVGVFIDISYVVPKKKKRVKP